MGYSDWSCIVTNYLPIAVKRDQYISVCKIGDHNSDQNIIDSKATTTLLRLRTARVEYKLISGPLLS
jgi:hypothetical protein